MTDATPKREPRPDGVYFNLPFEEYLAEPRFSSHAVKNILRSPTDFWVRSWMNPNPIDEDTEFKEMGRAYHCRVVEGKAVFDSLYAIELDQDDFDEDALLVTSQQIKDRLKEIGEGRGLSALSKAELVDRIMVCDPEALVWDRLVEDHCIANMGKTMIARKTVEQMEIAAANIEKHPDYYDTFKGGAAEVSVFWTDEVELASGELAPVKMKARIDYLKDTAVIELKSFGNNRGENLDAAIYSEMASRKYHIAVPIYYAASDKLKEFLSSDRVYGWTPEQIAANRKWLDAVIKNTEARTYFFLFQQTGPAPVAIGKFFNRGMGAYETGKRQWHEAMVTLVNNLRAQGTDYWITIIRATHFEDDEFRPWTWAL